jgi:spore coat polysaccharide biosynthesis predicted glycosyltransferase SpsG
LAEYHADILLNQNIGAEKIRYRCDPDTRILAGTRYVLLRPEFFPWRCWRREVPAIARKVLVSLGGGDKDNVTSHVVRALQLLTVDGWEAAVVIGATNPHRQLLESLVQDTADRIRLLLDPPDMAEAMAWADVAVLAGGSTCWEMALLGLPSLIIMTADNQGEVVTGLDRCGAGIALGWWEQLESYMIAYRLQRLMVDHETRATLSRGAQTLIDGYGKERVLDAMDRER